MLPEMTPPMQALIESLSKEERTYWDLSASEKQTFQWLRRRGVLYINDHRVICFRDDTLNQDRAPLANPLPEYTLNQKEWAYLERMCEPDGVRLNHDDRLPGVRGWCNHIYDLGFATRTTTRGGVIYKATAEGFDALEEHEGDDDDAP